MAKEKHKELTIEDVLVPVEEQPYEVPENWCWTTLNQVCFLENGYAFKSDKFSDEGIPVIRISNIFDNEVSIEGCVYTIEEDIDERFVVRNGDLLIAMSGATTGKNGVYLSDKKAYLNQRVGNIKIINHDVLLEGYRNYYIASKQEEILRKAYGGAQPNISGAKIGKMLFPLPPLSEQQRIVEKIESLYSKLDEAKDKAQEVIDGFDSRRAAILAQAFSGKLTEKWREEIHCYHNNYLQEIDQLAAKIGRKNMKKVQNDFADDIATIIPNSWASTDLERIARKITDGEHKTPKRVSEYCGYYLLSARNVRNGAISLEDVDYVDKDEYEKISKRCNPTEGDVLISCSGSVGRVCVVEDNNKYCMVRSAAVISLLAGVPRFVMYMLQSNYVQEQIKALTKQTAQANLFLGAISALVIPFPSKEEQEKIVEILDRILLAMEEAKDIAERTIEDIDLIKKSILTKAFRGELGTNDSSDEPAEELLKRILSEAPVEEKKKSTTRRTKVKAVMNKDMLEAVREAGKITPERLKEETGLGIDEFYEELKRLTESGQVSEKRKGGDVYLEVRDAN